MTREELLSTMSSKEFAEWKAYHKVEPLHNRRSVRLLGQLCSILANAHSEEDAEFSVDDFIPELEEDQPTVEELKQKAINITKQMGGEVNV